MKLQVPLTMLDQGVDAVGDQAVAEGVDDGDAATATGFEGDASGVLAGQGEEFRAACGEQTFVGGDDGFACPEGGLHVVGGGGCSADQFDDDVDFGIVDGGNGIDADGQSLAAVSLFGIANHHMAEVEADAGALAQHFVLIEQNGGDTAADDATTQKSDACGFVRHGCEGM